MERVVMSGTDILRELRAAEREVRRWQQDYDRVPGSTHMSRCSNKPYEKSAVEDSNE